MADPSLVLSLTLVFAAYVSLLAGPALGDP